MYLKNTLIPICFLLLLAACSKEENSVFEHPIQSIENKVGEWSWFDVDGMICRDRSSTGISVRLGEDRSKWVIYLQGGGACFTPETCQSNPSNYNANDFSEAAADGNYSGGILNRERSENPVKDWNVVFVPYCTGDVHSGNLEDGFPLGGTEEQQFLGNRNIRTLLNFLQPYLEHNGIDELMITGVSAGGFGTHITYFEAKEIFPTVKTHLINDSGPLVSDPEVLPFCLGAGLQLLYNLAIPDGFIFCCDPTYGLADIYTLASRYYNEDNFGLLSRMEDGTIRFFFGAGQNTCAGGEISGELFKQGLFHLRENVLKPTDKWSTFYATGEQHTFIQGNTTFYETSAEGKMVYQWLQSVMNGEVLHLEE